MIEVGYSDSNYQGTSEDHFRQIYFEALDLLIEVIKARFDHSGYQVYQNAQDLVLKTCNGANCESVLDFAVLPNYRILLFCNGFWPQNTTPENGVPFNGITSIQCQKGFLYNICNYWLIISSLMLDPLNHCYFTLLCYVASILSIKGNTVVGVLKCSSLSLSHINTPPPQPN